MLEVAKGNIDNESGVNKFGHNPAATTGDGVWPGGGVYDFYPTTGQLLEVVSSSTEDDNTTGDGTWTIQVYGLDANWAPQNVEVTMDGTTVVQIPVLTWLRVFRVICLTGGSTGTNEGTITVRITSAGTTAAIAAPGDGQTQMAMFTTAADTESYFLQGYVGQGNDTFQGVLASFQWQLKVNNGTTGQWQTKGQMPLVNIGSSHWQYEYAIPPQIPEKTDIRIIVSAAGEAIDAIAGFDLLTVDVS
jgi:hypothetical protein